MRSGLKGRFDRTDWLVFAGCVLAGLILRAPARSRWPFHWDSAQFALAINQYNISLSQPHAPGYFLYVMLGRLVNALVGDPHASLVWLSVIGGSVLVGLMYLLGASMFGGRVGMAAALLTLTSPLLWFNSCVALTYVVDACLACWFVLLCWRAVQKGGGWGYVMALGALGALIAGVRPQTALALVPVALVSFWKFGRWRLWKLLAAATVTIVLVTAWVVPMLQWSGGLALFRQIVHLHAKAHAHNLVLGGGGGRAFFDNVARAALFCWSGLLMGAVVIAAGLIYRAGWMDRGRRQQWNETYGMAFGTCAAWVTSFIVFGTVFALTLQPGYVLGYLPGLILLAALALDHLRNRLLFVTCTVLIVLAHGCVFASLPWNWQPCLGGFWYTRTEIREHDERMDLIVHSILERYDPAQTVICHAQEYLLFGLRHFQYALPAFDQYQMEIDRTIVVPPGKLMWRARQGRLEFVNGLDLNGKRTLLLVIPPGQSPRVFAKCFAVEDAHEVAGSGGSLFELTTEQAHPICNGDGK